MDTSLKQSRVKHERSTRVWLPGLLSVVVGLALAIAFVAMVLGEAQAVPSVLR
jgi:hypothetical protein